MVRALPPSRVWLFFSVFLLMAPLGSLTVTSTPGLPHLPILIAGDDGFTTSNGVTGGSGVVQDPYIIEGWTIFAVGAAGVELRNTTSHVVVRENQIHVSYATLADALGSAILLRGASNVTIQENTFLTNNRAIRAQDGQNVTIQDNHIESLVPRTTSPHRHGIMIERSEDVVVNKNHLKNLDTGILVRESREFTVSANTLIGIGRGPGGGSLDASASADGSFSHNYIHDCFRGISLWQSSRIQVHDNHIGGCVHSLHVIGVNPDGPAGIENDFRGNTIFDGITGMRFIGCDGCKIEQNLISRMDVGAAIGPGMTFENNTLRTNQLGIENVKGPHSIRHNALVENVVHVRALGHAALDARFNWFGSPDGPADATLEGDVEVDPWLTEPPIDAP